jgi:hypothetical protein
MNRFVATLAFVACAFGAPMPEADADASYGIAAAAPLGAYAHAPVAIGQTHHTYAAGPPIVQQHVEYGVVGHQTVQVGTQQVQAGHQYVAAGQEVIPQPAHSYVAGAVQNLVETHPLPPPIIPAPPAPIAAIPPAPIPAGPAPADTVVQERILAPVRTHTIITPQQTQIVPQLQVNKYNVDVPVNVPVPVEREVLVTKHVAKPYTVEVPRAVAVPTPYKVHPVQQIVEQPHIHHATYTTHHAQAVVAPVAAYAHAAPIAHAAVAAPVAAYAAQW